MKPMLKYAVKIQLKFDNPKKGNAYEELQPLLNDSFFPFIELSTWKSLYTCIYEQTKISFASNGKKDESTICNLRKHAEKFCFYWSSNWNSLEILVLQLPFSFPISHLGVHKIFHQSSFHSPGWMIENQRIIDLSKNSSPFWKITHRYSNIDVARNLYAVQYESALFYSLCWHSENKHFKYTLVKSLEPLTCISTLIWWLRKIKQNIKEK